MSVNPEAILLPGETGASHVAAPLGDVVAKRGLGRGGLAAVSISAGGDGIAYVTRLLHRAISDLTGVEPAVAELAPAKRGIVTFDERLRFARKFIWRQAQSTADWWLFSHVRIARVERFVPGFLRKPFALFLHGTEIWDPGFATEANTRLLAAAAARLTNSHFTARRVRELYPTVGPIEPCPLALLPEDLKSKMADSRVLAQLGERAVVIVGRMSADERYKGHDELIEAWPAVCELVPAAQLVIVGSGSDLERLRAKVSKTSVSKQILFTGFVDDPTLHALLGRAAMLAMPSRGEGFGIVYLQAMRAGLPCIASPHDAGSEVVIDGETGFIVDPADRPSLARSITDCLLSEDLRLRMGQAGRLRLAREYSFERFRKRLGSLLLDAFATRVEDVS